MERKEDGKLSKGGFDFGTSVWGRMSVKRSSTEPAVQLLSHIFHPPRQRSGSSGRQSSEEAETEQHSRRVQKVPQMNSPRSIIPDIMKEHPSWYHQDAWANVPLPATKTRYNIHNPIGPRWYKNHHLLPPSQTRPAARPPTVFSSSFPPITTSTSQERLEEATLLPGSSRTPSGSPLPTPNSSQTRVVDPNTKPRSRKNSETAHDNIDLMDVTDPWGTNWHHHSPYDVGLWNGPVSVGVQDVLLTRTRRASMTSSQKRQTVAPSPLSQSTSAINLSTPSNLVVQLPRKLSKRRTPSVDTNTAVSKVRKTVSLPATPMEPSGPLNPAVIPSTLPVSSFGPSLSKKEKRGSILDRLVKKFSILKKTTDRSSPARPDEWQHISTLDGLADHSLRPCPPAEELHLLENPCPDATLDIQLPELVDRAAQQAEDMPKDEIADGNSSLSFEAPFSIGRLTVANPDIPSSGDTTPAPREVPLPPDKAEIGHRSLVMPSEMGISGQNGPEQAPPPPLKDQNESITAGRFQRLVDDESSEKTNGAKDRPLSLSDSSRTQGTSSPSLHNNLNTSQRHATPSKTLSVHRYSHSSPKLQSAPPVPEKVRPTSIAHSIPFPSSDCGDASSSRTALPTLDKPRPSFYEFSPYSATSVLVNPPTPHSRDSKPPLFPDHRRTSTFYENSPHSASSLLANPPTPCTSDAIIPTPSDLPPPPLPKEKPPSLNHSSPVANGRQTETFKLIRSPSRQVYSTNAAIVAGGHQWELVEASDAKGRSKSISKDREKEPKLREYKERGSKERELMDKDFTEREWKDRELRDRDRDRERAHKEREPRAKEFKEREMRDKELRQRRSRDYHSSERRERKREGRSQDEQHIDAHHHYHSRSHRAEKTGSREQSTSTYGQGTRHGAESSSSHVRQESQRNNRRADQERDRKSELKAVETLHVNTNKGQPPPPALATDQASPERRPSLTVRPTSQLPSAAEMTALRAKEAWDMERLWKARSMNGDEPNGYAPFPSSDNTAQEVDEAHSRAAAHGSSHTAFIVQTPFQPQYTVYHTMPTAPPPIIYSSPASIPSIPSLATSTHSSPRQKPHAKSLISTTRSPAINPLPEPPRESLYEPARLSFPESNGRSGDYWAKLAGITSQ